MVLLLATHHSMLRWSRAYLVMVDPDTVSTIQSDGITAPDVLRVEAGDMDVLDDDIAGAVADSEALALDNASTSYSNDALVAAHVERCAAGIIIGAAHERATRAGIRDGQLASRCASLANGDPVTAARSSGGAFGASKVPGAVNEDGSSRAVSDPGPQPVKRDELSV